MFKALYSHVNNIIEKYLQIYNHILLYLQWVKKEKIKTKATIKPFHSLTQYIQICKNNDPLILNLVNKYVFSDLLKLKIVFDFRNS